MWCTTSSGNVKVKVKRSISFLCLPCLSHIAARTTQANSSFLASTGLGHGAWGLGWAGVRGTRGEGRSDTSQSVGGGCFLGFGFELGPQASRRTTGTARPQSQAWHWRI